MSNPYHDELGRFCSKSQMTAGIQRLIKAGKPEEAAILGKELQAIEKANEARKLLKTVPGPLLHKYEDTVGGLVGMVKHDPYGLRQADTEREDILLDGYSDEELLRIEAVLLQAERDFQDEEYAPFNKEREAFAEEIEKKTGFKSLATLGWRDRELTQQSELEGRVLISKLREELIENEIPKPYANYATQKMKTLLGFSETYQASTGQASFPVVKGELIEKVDPTVLTPAIASDELRDKWEATVSSFVKTNKEDIDAVNETLKERKKINDLYMSMQIRGANERGLLVKAHRLNIRARAFEGAKENIQRHGEWRKTLRSNGILTNNVAGRGIDGHLLENIKVDSEGKITNMWTVNRQKGEKNTVSRIVGVDNDGYSSYFVDENGNAHRSITHYHSFKTNETRPKFILDEKADGEISNKWKGQNFGYTIDSGD